MEKLISDKPKYIKAFQKGYDYAYGASDKDYGFGENSHEEDLRHVPKNVKDKERWIEDWMCGCAVGCEN